MHWKKSAEEIVLKLFLSGVVTIPSILSAEIVRHQVQAHDSPTSILTQGTCFDLYLTKSRLICAPTSYVLIEPGRLSIDGIFKVDDASIDMAQRAMTDKIDKSYVQKMFEQDSYEAASATAAVKAIYSTFALIYIPSHVSAAYKISNPSLPELSADGYTESQIRVSKNFVITQPGKQPDFFINLTPYVYDRKFYSIQTDIVQVAVHETDDIIIKTKERNFDFEGSLSIFPKQLYLPQISLSVFNVNQYSDCSECVSRRVNLRNDLVRHYTGTAAFSVPVRYGQLNLSVKGTYNEIAGVDIYDSPVNIAYKISAFTTAYTFSARRSGVGFTFNTDGYELGLQVSDEKQENTLQIDRKTQTYVFFKFFI